MNARTLITVLFGAAMTYTASTALAQTKEPKSFYDSGYADSPLKGSPSESHKAQAPDRVVAPEARVKLRDSGHEDQTARTSTPATEFSKEKLSGKPLPINSLSLIVDTGDNEQVFTALHDMAELVVRYSIHPGAIFLYGNPQIPSDAPYDWVTLVTLGARISSQPDILEKYPVKSSPSWIVDTPEGEIVLEGFSTPEQFLNSDGKFIQR